MYLSSPLPLKLINLLAKALIPYFWLWSSIVGFPFVFLQNQVFVQLLSKRRKLLDLREKVKNLNNNVIGDDEQITIHNNGRYLT